MSDKYVSGFGGYLHQANDPNAVNVGRVRFLMRPTPRGYTAFEIQQRIAEAQSKLSEVQRALRQRTEAQRIEEMIEYIRRDPFAFDMDLYVYLKWKLARARMHEDLERIIQKNRFAMAMDAYREGVHVGVDLASDFATDRTTWLRRPPIRVDRGGQRL